VNGQEIGGGRRKVEGWKVIGGEGGGVGLGRRSPEGWGKGEGWGGRKVRGGDGGKG